MKKFTLFGLPEKYFRNSVQPEQDKITAYNEFYGAILNTQEIYLDDKKYSLKFLAKGESKKIYDLGNNRAIALVNTGTPAWEGSKPSQWETLIDKEVYISQQFQEAGLHILPYEKTSVYVGEHTTMAITMPTFESLLNNGMQIRDSKNKKCGDSLLFGDLNNLQNANHWLVLLEGIKEDLILYYSKGLSVGSDSFNLVIKDTQEIFNNSSPFNRLIMDQKQKVHFYFYDFTANEQLTITDFKKPTYQFIDENTNVLRDNIREEVEYLFFDRVIDTIFNGLLDEEVITLLGSLPRFTERSQMLKKLIRSPMEIVAPKFIDEVTESIARELEKTSETSLKNRFLVDKSNILENNCDNNFSDSATIKY